MGRPRRQNHANVTETPIEEDDNVVVLDKDEEAVIYNKPLSQFSSKATDNPFIGLPTTVTAIPDLQTPINTIPSSPPWLLDPFEEPGSFKNTPNFILNITPDRHRYIWRPTNTTKTMYTMFHKYDDNKIRPQKIFVPGYIRRYINLETLSNYNKWQVKLLCSEEITDQINKLLALRLVS